MNNKKHIPKFHNPYKDLSEAVNPQPLYITMFIRYV